MTTNQNSGFIPLDQKEQGVEAPKQTGSEGFIPLQASEPDSLAKGASRTLLQIPLGIAEVTGPGIAANLWDLIGTGEALSALEELDEYRIAELKRQFPSAPWENYKGIDREKYLQNLQEARSLVPTVSNIASFIEKQTGIPLEPKTFMDKLARLSGAGGKLTPGTIAEKAKGAGTTAAIKAIGETAGVPEPITDVVALGLGPQGAKISVKPETKPSGLPTRRYESLKKPTKVTPGQAEKIVENVEKDVRSITDKLIQSESKTARAVKGDLEFTQKLDSAFDKVEKLAAQIPEEVSTASMKSAIRKRMKAEPIEGLSPDAYERAFKKEMNKLYKEIPIHKTYTMSDAVKQFRKNNKSRKELFEPGKSGAVNRAKRDALTEYNKAITDVFESKYPDSEFNSLFKFTNKVFSESKNLERIDQFFDKVFTKEKINFKEARKFFDSKPIKDAFKNTLGEDAYKDMSQIMKDFISTEQANKLIKVAQGSGFKDMTKLAGKWLLSPLYGKAAAGKEAFNFIRKSVLPNKKYRVIWKNSLDDFKKRKFGPAVEGFKKLEQFEEKERANSQKT